MLHALVLLFLNHLLPDVFHVFLDKLAHLFTHTLLYSHFYSLFTFLSFALHWLTDLLRVLPNDLVEVLSLKLYHIFFVDHKRLAAS